MLSSDGPAVSGASLAPSAPSTLETSGGVGPGEGGTDLPAEEQPLEVRANALRDESQDLAGQKSRMWSGVMKFPDTVAATVATVENAAVAKKGDDVAKWRTGFALPSPPRRPLGLAEFPIAVWTDDGNLLPSDVQANLENCIESGGSFPSQVLSSFTELKCIATSAANSKRVPPGLLVEPEAISSKYLKHPFKRAGAWLIHLENTMDMLLSKVPDHDIFKIGYAKNPQWRFQHYLKENMGYQTMHLVAVDMNVERVQLLEVMLIRLYAGLPGCQNCASGGEGPPVDRDAEDVPVFLYLVVGSGPFAPNPKRQRT